MNQSNLQQPAKKTGVVQKLLALAVLGNIGAGMQASTLLTNGYRAQIPAKFKNQRQKRKLAAQNR